MKSDIYDGRPISTGRGAGRTNGWRIQNWSVATKQFLLLFLVTVSLFAFLAFNNYTQTSKLFKTQIMNDAQTLMVRTNQFLDSYLDNGQNILLLLTTQAEFLKRGEERGISEFLRSIATVNSHIVKTLYIVREDGKVFCNAQFVCDVVNNPALPGIYEQASQNYAAMVTQPYYSPQSGQTVAIARSISDTREQPFAVAIVELDLKKLHQKMIDISSSTQTFMLLSNEDRLVLYDRETNLLPSLPNAYMTELPEHFIEEAGRLKIGIDSYSGPQGKLVTLRSGQNRLGWSLILFIKEEFFYKSIAVLFETFLTAGAIMLVVLLVMALIMSRFLTRPIRMLALKLDRVQDSIIVPQVTITRQDEIGRLTRSFYAMLERIQQLIVKTKEMEERKKELELKVLQSQISPHFLYNTLACIGSLARQQRLGEVGETIRSLVGILELTFDKTRAEVTVADEIRALKQYIQIQNIRYIGKFEFHCEVDPAIEHCTILKLTLQPLVENAIFHGILQGKDFPGMIVVRGKRTGGSMTFLICDNGIGIAKARQTVLLQPGMHGKTKDRLTGIGMSNVQERLRLHFGDHCGLRIRSTVGKGTCIRVTLPAIPFHERHGD